MHKPGVLKESLKVWGSRDFFHNFSILYCHSAVSVLSQMCVPPQRSASYFWSRIWNRCGLSILFLSMEFATVHFPACQVVKNKSQQWGKGRRDSWEEWGRKRGIEDEVILDSIFHPFFRRKTNSHLTLCTCEEFCFILFIYFEYHKVSTEKSTWLLWVSR